MRQAGTINWLTKITLKSITSKFIIRQQLTCGINLFAYKKFKKVSRGLHDNHVLNNGKVCLKNRW